MTTFHRDNITLIHGNCMDYLATLPDGAFSLAVVDPPYGLQADGNLSRMNGAGKLANRAINRLSCDFDLVKPGTEYIDELFRVSTNQIVWGGNYFSLPITRGIICWDKCQPWTNFSAWEMGWTSFDTPAKLFKFDNKTTDKIHPTQKPVALYRWLLQNYAKPGDTILDTHLGSGSSAIAAWEMGFTFTGIEIDQDYYNAAVARIEKRMLSPYLPGIVLPTAKQESLL